MESLAGRIVLVTGASSGIGRATALAFAAEGAKVMVCARRTEPLKELEPLLIKAGAAAVHLFELDVRSMQAVDDSVGALSPEWAEIAVLVNNAGLSRGMTKVYDDMPEGWDEMIDTNIKGLLYMTRAVVPGMVKRGAGHVINLGSTAGYITYGNGAVYCATKAAEKAISEGLKIDLMGTAVRVTSVDPGMVETNFSMVRFRGDEERAKKIYADIDPLQPEDVAEAIVWAATRPARINIHTILMTSIDQANSVTFHRH